MAAIAIAMPWSTVFASGSDKSGGDEPFVVLYDQANNAAGLSTGSQNFETANDAFDDFLGDDFVVPAGQTWNINQVNATGVYFNGNGPAVSFNVFFYPNVAGLPGPTATCTNNASTYTNNTGVFSINVSPICALPAGTYFVVVQANMDFATGGQWGWTDRTVTSNSPAVWKNPGGGFTLPQCLIYAPRGATCNIDPAAPDQVFQILGNIAGGPSPTPSPTPTVTPFTPSPTPSPGTCSTYTQSTSTGATIVPGTTLVPGSNCDDCSNPVAIPFTFIFYGQAFTSVNAISNGNLQFNSSDTSFTNTCLPYTAGNYVISPHWDDMLLTGAGQGIFTSITGTAPNRILNIEWIGGYFAGGGTADFEVRLYEGSNQIDFVYGTVTQGGSSATVGIQKDTGSVFTQFECNTAGTITSGLKVTYTCAGSTPAPTPTPSPTRTPTPTPTPSVSPSGSPSPSPTCAPALRVVPNEYTNTQASTAGLNTLIRDTGNPRTAQLLINANQLTGLIGQSITSFTARLYSGATVPYPATAATWTDYTVSMGQGVAFGTQTTTFASNFVGTPTVVRSGPLTIPASAFGATGSPKPFGSEITFTTPFVYTGGNLLIEVRHTGSNIVNNAANDFLEVALTTDPNYNTNFWSATATGNTATTGAVANFTVVRLNVGGACATPSASPSPTRTPTPTPTPSVSPSGSPSPSPTCAPSAIWALWTTPASGAGTARLVTFAPGTPQTFNIIGDTGINTSTTFPNGLDFDGAGNLFATSNANTNFLFSINQSTGAGTLVGGSGLQAGDGITDLSWDGFANRMLAIAIPSAGGTARIYTINTATGAATNLGTVTGAATETVFVSLAVRPSDGLIFAHGVATDRWYTINPSTLAATPLGLEGFDSNFGQGGTFDPNTGVLYHAAFNNTAFAGELYTVNTTTGAGTFIGQMGTNTNPQPDQVSDIGIKRVVCGTPTPTPSLSPGITPTPTPPPPSPTPSPCVPTYTRTTSTGATIVPGTTLVPGSNCDDCSNPVAIPFTFNFYGQPFTSVNAVSNGNLQFNSADTSFTNTCLPYTAANYAIMPHWDDMLLTGAGQGIFTSVTGSAPNRILNIEWTGGYFSGGGTADFEARLYETTGQIDFVYGVVTQGGSSATIGIQKDLGSIFDQFACNTAGTVTSGLKVTYVPQACGTPTPSPSVSPTRTPTPTPTVSPTPSVSPSPTGSPATTMQFSMAAFPGDESQVEPVTITRTGIVTATSSVSFSTTNGTAIGGAACTSGVDYLTITNQPVQFNPGETTKTVFITLCPDTLVEPVETINLVLSAPIGGSIGNPGTAVMNINDTANAFRNTTEIDFTLGAPAAPYPSTITVTNGPVQIGSIRVTLYDVTHQLPDNMDFLLVGPTGVKYIFMADAGGPQPLTTPVTLTFSDAAANPIPNNGPLVTGSFKPVSWEAPQSSFAAPAPPAPYIEPNSTGVPTMHTAFGFTNSNGTWSLYARDDNSTSQPNVLVGMVAGGWGLEFLQTTAAGVSMSGRVTTADGAGIRNARVVVTGNSLPEPRVATTGSFGYFSFDGLEAGQTYVVTVNSQRYTFQTPSRVITLVDNLTDVDFTADPQAR